MCTIAYVTDLHAAISITQHPKLECAYDPLGHRLAMGIPVQTVTVTTTLLPTSSGNA